jgi:hypothetical protein
MPSVSEWQTFFADLYVRKEVQLFAMCRQANTLLTPIVVRAVPPISWRDVTLVRSYLTVSRHPTLEAMNAYSPIVPQIEVSPCYQTQM